MVEFLKKKIGEQRYKLVMDIIEASSNPLRLISRPPLELQRALISHEGDENVSNLLE
jgi:hypothetical protein